jgi:hypothetical protein
MKPINDDAPSTPAFRRSSSIEIRAIISGLSQQLSFSGLDAWQFSPHCRPSVARPLI